MTTGLEGRCSIQLSYGQLVLVGVERFELPTSCSQSKRATRLRYTPSRRQNYTTHLSVLPSPSPKIFYLLQIHTIFSTRSFGKIIWKSVPFPSSEKNFSILPDDGKGRASQSPNQDRYLLSHGCAIYRLDKIFQ